MRIVVAAVLSLALLASNATADETVESAVTGTLKSTLTGTGQSTVTGTLTINVRPARPAAKPDNLRECDKKWTAKLARHEKTRENDKKLHSLTRMDYRKCMYQCLGDATRNDAECTPPGAPSATPASGPSSVRPTG